MATSKAQLTLMAQIMAWTTVYLPRIAWMKTRSTARQTPIVQPIDQADDGSLDAGGTDSNVKGSLDFDGIEDGMHHSSLDSNGNLTTMASAKASSTARWTRMERLAGLG
jgi:hypothetical protein